VYVFVVVGTASVADVLENCVERVEKACAQVDWLFCGLQVETVFVFSLKFDIVLI
jgi:hypothetical protein